MNLAHTITAIGLLCGFALPALAQEATIIRGASILAPDGTITAGRGVLIQGEKIASVAAEDSLTADVVHDYPGAVICPGLIDAYSRIGTRLGRDERFHPIDPSLSIVDGLDSHDPALARAFKAGITTVVAVPAENLIVGGAAAVVRTWADGPGLDVIRADGPIAMSLGESVFDLQLEPTSRAGAVAMLRHALTESAAGRGHPRLASVMAGELPALIRCERSVDVGAAMMVFHGPPRPLSIVHTADLLDLAEDLEGSDTPIIVGPFSFGTSSDILAGPGAVAARGLPIAFATADREPDALRTTAALAVRYGLDPAVARRGLTVTAAKTAGVDSRVGSLSAGLDADIVVFSADPLRLDARVLAIYVRGRRVYAEAPPLEETIESSWKGAGS